MSSIELIYCAVATVPVSQADALAVQIVNALRPWLQIVVTGVVAYLIARLNNEQARRSRETTAKVEEVRATLEATTAAAEDGATNGARKLDDLAAVALATHTLVNGHMGEQLLINRTLARQVAVLNPSPEATRVADLAGLRYDDHQAKQGVLDGQKPNGGIPS